MEWNEKQGEKKEKEFVVWPVRGVREEGLLSCWLGRVRFGDAPLV